MPWQLLRVGVGPVRGTQTIKQCPAGAHPRTQHRDHTDAVHIYRGVLARVGYRWDQRANSRPGFVPPQPLSPAVVRRIRRRQFAMSVVLILLLLTTALISWSHLTTLLIVFLAVSLVFSGLSEAMLRRRKLWPNRSDGLHD
jgi:hypothetical protein